MSLFGPVCYQRHYYHCPHCRRGFCPLDQLLGLTAQDLTPACDQLACLAGVLTSFAEAADKVLPALAHLQLAESTVERATEAAGRRVGAALQAGQTFGTPTVWAGHKDAEGKTVRWTPLSRPKSGKSPSGFA